MAWPTTAWVDGDFVTAGQLNAMPVRIADTTLGASSASITFSSIPQHYAHLWIIFYARSDRAGATDGLGFRFNGDTAGNYDAQAFTGQAATPSAGEAFAGTYIGAVTMPSAFDAANLFCAGKFVAPHYANAANNKVASVINAYKKGTATTNMQVTRLAGFWRSSSAVTTITAISTTGNNFVSGTRMTLYGLP